MKIWTCSSSKRALPGAQILSFRSRNISFFNLPSQIGSPKYFIWFIISSLPNAIVIILLVNIYLLPKPLSKFLKHILEIISFLNHGSKEKHAIIGQKKIGDYRS